MTKKQELNDYFEVFYHPNEFISQFKYAFESLADSLYLIKTEYPNFLSVVKDKIRYPLVTVSHRKTNLEETPLHYFAKVKSPP